MTFIDIIKITNEICLYVKGKKRKNQNKDDVIQLIHKNYVYISLGSSQPSFPDDGKLRLFSMRFCPFAHRVHLVLNVKNLPYHVFNINLTDKPEWYLELNPNGKVPALQLTNEPDKSIMVESLAIAEYLDEKYPDIKLYPTDPQIKDETNQWIERFTPIATAFYKLVYETNSDEVNNDLLSIFYKELAPFEAELIKRNTPYFAGTEVGIFDYAIWPWFERFGILSSIVDDKYNLDERFPKLVCKRKMLFNLREFCSK